MVAQGAFLGQRHGGLHAGLLQAGHHALVDLDLGEGKLGQHGQAGIAGAEVVQRQLYTGADHGRNAFAHGVDVGHGTVLGDLYRQQLAGDAGHAQQRHHPQAKTRHGERGRRHVHRQGQGPLGLQPLADGVHHGFHGTPLELDQQLVTRRHLQHQGRRDRAPTGILGAQQGLGRQHLAGAQIALGLVRQRCPARADPVDQQNAQLLVQQGFFFERAVKKPQRPGIALQCQAEVAQNGIGRLVPAVIADGHAHAQAGSDLAGAGAQQVVGQLGIKVVGHAGVLHLFQRHPAQHDGQGQVGQHEVTRIEGLQGAGQGMGTQSLHQLAPELVGPAMPVQTDHRAQVRQLQGQHGAGHLAREGGQAVEVLAQGPAVGQAGERIGALLGQGPVRRIAVTRLTAQQHQQATQNHPGQPSPQQAQNQQVLASLDGNQRHGRDHRHRSHAEHHLDQPNQPHIAHRKLCQVFAQRPAVHQDAAQGQDTHVDSRNIAVVEPPEQQATADHADPADEATQPAAKQATQEKYVGIEVGL